MYIYVHTYIYIYIHTHTHIAYEGNLYSPAKSQAGEYLGEIDEELGYTPHPREKEFFIDTLLVRIHFIIEMILVDQPCAMGAAWSHNARSCDFRNSPLVNDPLTLQQAIPQGYSFESLWIR